MDPILLGAYAASRCPRRVHNEFDKTIATSTQQLVPSQLAQERIEAGLEFEAHIRQTLRDLHGEDVVTIDPSVGRSEAMSLTTAAMVAGTPIVLGGWLPNDPAGGRKGRPDILLRDVWLPAASDSGGAWAYLPVDVKNHKMLSHANHSRGDAVLSSLLRPTYAHRVVEADYSGRRNRYEVDMLQLAHYWRMLQACGHAGEDGARGGVIGADQLESSALDPVGPGHVITWLDLEAAMWRTYSRSDASGRALRTALERYDHEFAFRLDIADVAVQRTGHAQDPEPLVDPIWVSECSQCPWQDYCAQELGPDNASLAVGRLSARQWNALAQLGISTVDELASLDADHIANFDADLAVTEVGSAGSVEEVSAATTDAMVRAYLPQFADPKSAQRSLAKAVRSAQMLIAGEHLSRSNAAPVDILRADIELHLDIESDRSSRVYLWGVYLVDNTAATKHYEHISRWAPMDDRSEAELALQFWRYLISVIQRATTEGVTLRVYHYAKPEPNALMKLAKQAHIADSPTRDEVEGVIADYFVDLFTTVKSNFYGRRSLGLKDVAHYGAEFSWRDDDPGGAQSQIWLDDVYAGDSSMITRILEYNEDDVRATDAVLTWLDTNFAS